MCLVILSACPGGWSWMIKIGPLDIANGTSGATIFGQFDLTSPSMTCFSRNDRFRLKLTWNSQISSSLSISPLRPKRVLNSPPPHPKTSFHTLMAKDHKAQYRKLCQSHSQLEIPWHLLQCSFVLSTRPKTSSQSGHLTERGSTCCTLTWRVKDAWLQSDSCYVQWP